MSLELLFLVLLLYASLWATAAWTAGLIAPAAFPAVALGCGLVLTGVEHYLHVDAYVRVMQDWIPAKQRVVLISVGVRVLGGLGLLFAATRPAGAIATLVLLIITLPVNLRIALAGDRIKGLKMRPWRRWFRLGLHACWIAWAVWCVVLYT